LARLFASMSRLSMRALMPLAAAAVIGSISDAATCNSQSICIYANAVGEVCFTVRFETATCQKCATTERVPILHHLTDPLSQSARAFVLW
jgi:hypothetical protein